MSVALNMLAVALMVVLPFVRPCNCGDFTLWCQCDANAQAAAKSETEPPRCPHCAKKQSEKNGENAPSPDKHEDAPCKKQLAPELGNGITADINLAMEAAPPAVAPLFELQSVIAVQPRAERLPIAQPPPTSLLVVRTKFLRI